MNMGSWWDSWNGLNCACSRPEEGKFNQFREVTDVLGEPSTCNADVLSPETRAAASKQRGRGQGTCPPADFDQRTTPLRLSPIANSAALHSGRIGRHCRSSLDTDLQSLIAAWDGLPEAKLKFGSLTDQQPTRRHRVRPLMAEILQKHRDDRLPHGPREKRRPLRSLVAPI
jgi:hypothetical protein